MSKTKILLAAVAAFTGLAATTEIASAAIYCTYIGYPHGCIARPGVRLVARPGGVGPRHRAASGQPKRWRQQGRRPPLILCRKNARSSDEMRYSR